MRDPQRIREILEIIANIWYKNPDLRLGQILVNATSITGDMFYVEDDLMLKGLRRLESSLTKM